MEYKVGEIIRYNFEYREIGNRLNLNVKISITKEIYVYLNRFRNWTKNRLLSILISSSLLLTKQHRKGGSCIFYYVGLQPCGDLSLWVLIYYINHIFPSKLCLWSTSSIRDTVVIFHKNWMFIEEIMLWKMDLEIIYILFFPSIFTSDKRKNLTWLKVDLIYFLFVTLIYSL